jgi:O-methyltransferase domain/IclR helix-turn-helix domain
MNRHADMHQLPVSTANIATSTRDVYRLLSSFWIAQAIHVVAALRIADFLAAGGQTAAELARATSMHAPSLYRVLRALAHVGIFAERPDGRFLLTPAAECLRTDARGSLHGYALMMGGQWVWRSCGEMLHSVQTGQTAFEHLFGASEFEFYARHPDADRISAAGLTSRSAIENPAILSAYNFDAMGTAVDIGGGEGTLLRSMLEAYPRMHGILFDRPEMLDGAKRLFSQSDMASRCSLQAGDFFQAIPCEGDVYILKKVLHDWDDERASEILRNCRKAIRDHARLLIVEMLVGTDRDGGLSAMLDLLMLVYTGGRERTEPEYGALLTASGFNLRRVIPTASAVNIIEAVPG